MGINVINGSGEQRPLQRVARLAAAASLVWGVAAGTYLTWDPPALSRAPMLAIILTGVAGWVSAVLALQAAAKSLANTAAKERIEDGLLERMVADRTAALGAANTNLEQRNREMEQFVYTASHDLKSPIVTIQGFLGHVERDLERGQTERLPPLLRRIRDASTRMRASIDDLLELSRIGRALHPTEAIDLNKVMDEVADTHALAIAQLGVSVEVQPDLPTLQGDRSRVTQVLNNLVANALKHGCTNPHPRIEVRGERRPDCVRLMLRDNGKGVPQPYREKVFGLFERLDKSVEGTGVGLAIVKRVVELHGGKVWIESAPEGGAEFWMSFPTRAGALTPAAPLTEETACDHTHARIAA